MKRTIHAGLVALLMSAAPAFADHGFGDPRIDERQIRLEQRLEQGWRSGELTRREYRRLQYELREIGRAERFFLSDGYLSPRERGELHARLEALSREIYLERHDVERRYGSYNQYGYPAYGRY